MRQAHERIGFSIEVCSSKYDELDVTAMTREILASAQARLRRWIGAWLDPVEHRGLAIAATQRRSVAFYKIELQSPPTIRGRMLTYLLGLTLAADRPWCDVEARRLGLIALRGPSFDELAAARALPFLHRGEPCLLEWEEVDGDAFALSHPDSSSLRSGRLDSATRARIDEARRTGRGDDPLSARVFLPPDEQGPLARRFFTTPAAWDEVALLRELAAETLDAILASSRCHGGGMVGRFLRTIISRHVSRRETRVTELLAEAWRQTDEDPRIAALMVEGSLLHYMRWNGDRVERVTWETLAPMLAEAHAAGGRLAEEAGYIEQRRR